MAYIKRQVGDEPPRTEPVIGDRVLPRKKGIAYLQGGAGLLVGGRKIGETVRRPSVSDVRLDERLGAERINERLCKLF